MHAPKRLVALLALALVLLPLLPGRAGAEPGGTLRVGTSGDYAPFSVALPEPERGEAAPSPPFRGFDIRVAEAYAADRGLAVEWVRFRWPQLLSDLRAGRFDLAMSGVTVRPERSAVGRFSVPVARTGAVVLVREPDRWGGLTDLDRRPARIGVNAGGHLEQVATRRFRRATLLAIPDNASVLQALQSEAVDAVVTEQIEARLWRQQAPGAVVYGPFTRDRKAYLVRADRPELAADLDAWLLEREADGRLAALRAEHLAGAGGATATPLAALLAALDERLQLMPLVGVAKRDQGFPLEVPEREAQVLDAAVASVVQAAERAEREPPPEAAVRALFRAQIEAAKHVQWAAVQDRGFRPTQPLPDVEAELRPALLRIGERIAALVLRLPPGLQEAEVQLAALDALGAPYLEEADAEALARAVAALSPPTAP